MGVPSLYQALWKIRSLDVAWIEKTNEQGVRQKRRQLSATVEKDVDSWSVALFGQAFTNAPDSVTDLQAYVGDGNDNTQQHAFTFFGTWYLSSAPTDFDGGRAKMVLNIWQYTGAWEDVPIS